MTDLYCVNLPDIGEGVVEGEVIEWLKEVGDPVAKDEPVVVVMTDKATVELPAPYPGTLSRQHYQPGEVAIRDEPLYEIELDENVEAIRKEETLASKPHPAAPGHPGQVSLKPTPKPCTQRKERPRGGRVLATPPVRRLARELGIDIQQIQGTGPDGRVTRTDLQTSTGSRTNGKKRAGPSIIPGQSTPPWRLEGDEEQPLIGLRNYIAEKMVEAKYLVPHFAYFDDLDAGRLMQMRSRIKEEASAAGVRLTFMPFFLRALSLVLKEFPVFNSSVDLEKNTLILHKQQNIGVAMKNPDGLIVPVLKGVQDMSFHELIQSYDALRRKAEANQLESRDMKESTFTISNYGTEGGKWATPIINYPEVAILGLARIQKQAVVRHDEVVVRPMLNVTLCGDHRVLDGDVVARFINRFCWLLENPASLL